jgi:hypothetical protein
MNVEMEIVERGLVKVWVFEDPRADLDPLHRCPHAVAVRGDCDRDPRAYEQQRNDAHQADKDEAPTTHASSLLGAA